MRIFVIHDQREVLNTLDETLSSAKGIDGKPYEVIPEQDHQKALELVQQERFEVIVVDMVTDERLDEGLDIVRMLAGKSPVTIVLTAYPSISNCVAAMRGGAWDYLEKNPGDGSDPYENLLRSIEEGCNQRRKQLDLGQPDPNAQWIHENLEWLSQRYAGRAIAVLYEQILYDAPTYGEVLDYLKDKFFLIRPCVFLVPDPNKEVV